VVTVPKHHSQTDGQTGGQTDDMQSHNRALLASRGKNVLKCHSLLKTRGYYTYILDQQIWTEFL